MDNLNIRITRRTELGDRALESSIDIDLNSRTGSEPALLGAPDVTASGLVGSIANTSAPRLLEWSGTLCEGERVNHTDAERVCAALGEGWRLPTRAELLSLVDDTRCDPAIDTERFPDTKSGAYWTSTTYAGDSSVAWVVYFYNGNSLNFLRDYDGAFVRAVRSLPAGQ